MGRHYSAARRGFFNDQVHETLPGDALEVADAQWSSLLDQQSAGATIVPGPDGKPIAVGPSLEERAVRLRTARNRALSETDSLIARHRDEGEMVGVASTLTRDQYRQIQGWRQSLRDLPKVAGFPDIPLPAKPEWLP